MSYFQIDTLAILFLALVLAATATASAGERSSNIFIQIGALGTQYKYPIDLTFDAPQSKVRIEVKWTDLETSHLRLRRVIPAPSLRDSDEEVRELKTIVVTYENVSAGRLYLEIIHQPNASVTAKNIEITISQYTKLPKMIKLMPCIGKPEAQPTPLLNRVVLPITPDDFISEYPTGSIVNEKLIPGTDTWEWQMSDDTPSVLTYPGSVQLMLPVLSAPTITNIDPNQGLTTGGTDVTITGTNFIYSRALTVAIGGKALTDLNVVSSTQITGKTPASVEGAKDVVVDNAGGTATLIGGFTYKVPAPEMDVRGNAISIVDNPTSTPNTADGTDFGTVPVTSYTSVHTFVIHNLGTDNLNLAVPISINGSHSSDFTVTQQPTTPIEPNKSTTFQITFDPNAAGLRSAAVSIVNNDSNENPYDFAIQGTGYNACLYLSDISCNSVLYANIDGTNTNAFGYSGGGGETNIAVNATNVFWSCRTEIKKANLDESGENPDFIEGIGVGYAPSVYDVAVNATHIFWTNIYTNSIGRANLDGSGVNTAFITGCSRPFGVAMNPTHIFWTNYNGGTGIGTIGRAKLNGAGGATEINQSFISCVTKRGPAGLAINGTYIFWSCRTDNTIARAKLDGSEIKEDFITTLCYTPFAVDVNDSHIFWASAYSPFISKAKLPDGTEVQGITLTSPPGNAFGLAVTPTPSTRTASGLVSLQAKFIKDHTTITWKTAAELNITGFHIWRSKTKDGEYQPITGYLVPIQGGATWGATYEYNDFAIVPGTTYWYKLQAMDGTESGAFQGPISTDNPR